MIKNLKNKPRDNTKNSISNTYQMLWLNSCLSSMLRSLYHAIGEYAIFKKNEPASLKPPKKFFLLIKVFCSDTRSPMIIFERVSDINAVRLLQ